MTRRPNGFTLIEILVALAVLGALIAGLGQGIRVGLRAWNTATRMTEAGDSLDTVDRTLRTLVGRMDPGSATDLPRLSATAHSLAFVTTLPDMPAMASNRVEASLGVDAKHRLVLRWRPYERSQSQPGRSATGTGARYNEIELLDGVAGMDLSYWTAAGGWAEDWRAEGLPPLVRIRVGLLRPGQRPWPDIVVAPELDRP
jgi:general secretion pathway protein J